MPSIVRTLVSSGFQIEGAERPAPNTIIVNCYSRDRLGSLARSCIMFAPKITKNLQELLESKSSESGATPIIVSPECVGIDPPKLAISEFDRLLGGRVETHLVSLPNIEDVFQKLGHGVVSIQSDLSADDLLEEAVKESLQFMLEGDARRFGQDRLFESLPDGVAFGLDQFSIYFDAKAYGTGFHPSSDDIIRFAGYVNDYNSRYSRFLGTLHAFLVVTGAFSKSGSALDKKAEQFYAKCKTQIVFLKSADLGAMVKLFQGQSHLRKNVDWKSVFSTRHGTKSQLQNELTRITKDNLIS